MENKDKPILNLIQQLKDKTRDPSTLTQDQRQQVVEVLRLEGYSLSQIAQIVDVCEKTIKRDIGQIRARNSLSPSVEFVKQYVGDLLTRADTHQTRLMRLARDADGSVSERAQAEYLSWRVAREKTEMLQSLGYLPLQPQKIVGNILHHVSAEETENSLEQTEKKIREIESVAKEAGTLDASLVSKLDQCRKKLEEAKLNIEVEKLSQQQNDVQNEGETHV